MANRSGTYSKVDISYPGTGNNYVGPAKVEILLGKDIPEDIQSKIDAGSLAPADWPYRITPTDGKTEPFITKESLIRQTSKGGRKQRKTKRRSSKKTKKTRGRRRH